MIRFNAIVATALLTAALLSGCDEEEPLPVDGADAVAGDASAVADDVPTVLTDLGNQDCHLDAECIPEGDDVLLPQCQVIACVEFKCVFLDLEDGLECDDGDLCSTGDQCQVGVCGGEALSCDDNNACTSDNCDPGGGCVNTFNQKPCDDGDDCTIQDHCAQGACLGQALQCDDGNPCTDDLCSTEGGCVWTHNTGLCSDANACTVGDSCSGGKCVPGGDLNCGDSTECLLNTCDPVAGCSQTVVDGSCEDGDLCTDNDICMDTVCVGQPVSCDDANPCTDDLCQVSTGACEHVSNTGPCDDGDSCSLVDSCEDGLCAGGSPDPLCCENGGDVTCDDGDPCTQDDCVDEYCAFAPLDCSDGSVCTLDSCAEGICLHDGIGGLPAGNPVAETFSAESGLAAWTVVTNNPLVTWQVDTLKVVDSANSVYCGNVPAYSYDLGATDATLSRAVSIPEVNPKLRYWITQDVADATCNYDFTTVTVNGVALPVEHCGAIPSWTEVEVDLAAWAGYTVELQFRFQTIDALSNKGQGVWVDEVRVVGEDLTSCCLSVDDCSQADGCLAPTCAADTWACTTPVGAEACDDSDPCTSDLCGEDGACASTPIEGCCGDDTDCSGAPDLPCEQGVCEEGFCVVDSAGCCAGDEDCVEAACADSACDVGTGQCIGTPIPGCCVDASDCDDEDACTQDECDASSGESVCANEPIEGCCQLAQDCPAAEKACEVAACDTDTCGVDASACCADAASCDDLDVCTTDTCDDATGLCGNLAVEGCCQLAQDCPAVEKACEVAVCDADTCGVDASACCTDAASCDDLDVCTTDTCGDATGLCGNLAVEGCCNESSECPGDDAQPCATPTCDANTCGLDTSACDQ